MATKDYLNYRLNAFRNEVPKLKKKLSLVENSLNALDAELDTLTTKIDNFNQTLDEFHATTTRSYERQIKKLQNQIELLEKRLSKQTSATDQQSNPVVVEKAKTIAVFDAILGAITSWSQEGDLASDVEAASQSVLFPSVYERVMSGNDPAYLLSDVPATASLVVQRGREYVRWIRSECETAITSPEAWVKYAPEVQKWWLTDGLPLLYGEADPDWEDDVPYNLEQIETWRNNPADRMIAFPKIYDAMEIYKANRKEIIEQTSILDFNKQTTTSRLS